MIKRVRSLKIRSQFALLILCAGLLSFFLFETLWVNKWPITRFLTGSDFLHTQVDNMDFVNKLYETAKNYDIPDSENDMEKVEDLTPFLNMADKYTSIYIYDLEDGFYRAGRYASIMDDHNFRFFFDLGYRMANGEGEDVQALPLAFRNGNALVMLYNYQHAFVSYPYLIGCLLLCILLFLSIVLFFLNRKMRSVLILKREILTMASGDLTHPLPDLGGDEIGILAEELDGLRNSLSETIQKEQESRKANQDLITALSHDLRTPLTILTGYLEVLHLKRNPGSQEEYLKKCIKKAEDIKELTDKMFAYALVSEENETPEFTWISTDFIAQCLMENCDFIKLAGFSPAYIMPAVTGVLESDKTMLKRIFHNLFSNILKYGDKKQPVIIDGKIHRKTLIIHVSNAVKQEHSQTGGNHIGLKNVQNMTALLNGSMSAKITDTSFAAELRFPLR